MLLKEWMTPGKYICLTRVANSIYSFVMTTYSNIFNKQLWQWGTPAAVVFSFF